MLIKKHEKVDGARAAARSLRSLSKRVVITDVWTEITADDFPVIYASGKVEGDTRLTVVTDDGEERGILFTFRMDTMVNAIASSSGDLALRPETFIKVDGGSFAARRPSDDVHEVLRLRSLSGEAFDVSEPFAITFEGLNSIRY